MRVLKFGGSSVANSSKIKEVKKIIKNHPEDKKIVVVSALGNTTDHLVQAGKLACEGNIAYKKIINEIRQLHTETVNQLLKETDKDSALQETDKFLISLEQFLNGIFLIKEASAKSLDYVLSFGERLSANIMSKTIDNACYIDCRDCIKTDNTFGSAKVDFDLSAPLVTATFQSVEKTPVVPGFIASTAQNETSTLGRGGSDFTAAILASILEVEALEIWTDVDGFMTADPRKVKKAFPISSLSYAETMELSHFGASVIYTPTVQPVYQKNIPVIIKNTLNPSAKGTLIVDKSSNGAQNPIKGISSIDNIALLTVQGSGLIGVTGTSRRLFSALASQDVNIVLISQASSEYSISFAVSPEDKEKAVQAIKQEFEIEMVHKNIIHINIEENLSIVAIVGENMKKTPGISAKLFNSLGRNGINVIAIAQGSSELNISIVIDCKSLKKALNVIHEEFFLSDYIQLNLFQVGFGTVGGDLLSQINQQQEKLLNDHGLKINVAGIADIDSMIFNEEGINLDTYSQALKNDGEKSDLQKFVDKMKEMNLRNSVFIDCTASKAVSALYKQVLNSYISVVVANKIACSSGYSLYEDLKKISLKRGVKFLYETNVGAGLPVIKTIGELIKSGDKIVKLEAVLSGTLNFIFNELSEEIPMSKAIKMALEKGYSEPDPRIDLSGIDVLRKILILSRESGYKLEQSDILTKPFLPDEYLQTKSLEEFWNIIPNVDAEFEEKREKLSAENKRWRYVAKLENGTGSIQLMEVDSKHPFYYLEGSDNIVSITTERYIEQPMIIKGAGAGAAVTATGVFADIIRVVNI